MKITNTILFCFCFLCYSVSQCDNVYLQTQAAMDTFDCEKVTNLTIYKALDEADLITDFSNLSFLDTSSQNRSEVQS